MAIARQIKHVNKIICNVLMWIVPICQKSWIVYEIEVIP